MMEVVKSGKLEDAKVPSGLVPVAARLVEVNVLGPHLPSTLGLDAAQIKAARNQKMSLLSLWLNRVVD